MANEQNLVRPSPSEARKNGRKGGKASAAAKKERKKLKEELLLLLSDSDTQGKICLALIRQAQRGNIKAFEAIRDTIGEKPAESIEISKNTSKTIADIEAYMAARAKENRKEGQ